MLFGLVDHDSDNLGDDIQSIAAERFLPRVDCLVPRENLSAALPVSEPVKLILNGWFMHNPQLWPPHPRIVPLIISFHITPGGGKRRALTRTRAQDRLLSGKNRPYLLAHGPVGARDRSTLAMLRRRGVDAYHSGCLTLTLQPSDSRCRTDEIVAVDLPAALVRELARRSGREPVTVTHAVAWGLPRAERQEQARALLDLYGRAQAVVTSRLHCALPCLALGTPVLFVGGGFEPYRVEPALELAHSCTEADFLLGRDGFDPLRPPPNPDRHLPLAEKLERRCREFIAAPIA